MSKKTKTKGYLLAAIAGGIVGAVSALLLAPKSGKELRGDIKQGAVQVSDKTVHIASQAKDGSVRLARQFGRQTTELAGKARGAATQVIEDIKAWRGKLAGAETTSAETLAASSVIKPEADDRSADEARRA